LVRSDPQPMPSSLKLENPKSAVSVELRDSHADLKSYLDARLGKMDEDISLIKARIGM
jgi:hypothetical protein